MNFSISIPHGLKDWQAYLDILYPEYFHGIEIPGEYLATTVLQRYLKKTSQKIVNVIDLTEPSILRNAAFQEEKVRNSLFELINKIITFDKVNSPENFLIDFGFCPQSNNKKEETQRQIFLKKFAYSLYKKNCTISIPVNINADFSLEKYAGYYFRIIQDSMFHLFKLSLNISPHDLKKTVKPTNIYEKFIFDIKNIRILYEPDTGNYLTEKLLLFWLEPLLKASFRGDIIITPKTLNNNVYEAEVKKITTIITSITPKLK
ncbi:MAG: hypothetical protein K9L78_01095 [Victivallales bacterium]|nr:hypothetical protein [Victivallales bacterium]MCF7888693.1 hypothetical protein [Victivallales bacterium]